MADLKGIELSLPVDQRAIMMADSSKPIPSVPKETARAANAIFGRSNFHILVGENLETILENIQLEGPSGKGGISKLEISTLALITFFQFVEGLTDIQATDAVRTRTDWKFALHLSLLPAILHESALCEFRQRMLIDFSRQIEFQRLIDHLVKLIPSICNSSQDLKVLDIVTFVCSINRLNRAQQAMHQALEVLALQFPQWLRKVALPHWYGRYNRATPRLEVAMLLGQQRFLMEEIGADIHHLLSEVHQSGSRELNELHEIKVLSQIWAQQFQTPYLNQWPENLTLDHCNVCPYKAVGRRM
jgi:transposase